jgi:hypothetical protein
MKMMVFLSKKVQKEFEESKFGPLVSMLSCVAAADPGQMDAARLLSSVPS